MESTKKAKENVKKGVDKLGEQVDANGVVMNRNDKPITEDRVQEMIDALPPEGGTVFIPSGLYELKASVALRSDISLVGAGFTTILRHVDETKSSLAQDASEDQNQVVVTDSTGFEVGMNVLMKIAIRGTF